MSGGHSIHELRPDAYNAVWDNSIEPALEVADGDVVELHARDASDGQLTRHSTPADVAGMDFDRVNPVSGPVFVKGARPGDTLAVELLEFRPPDWAWTAIIPGFGLLAADFPDAWLAISEIDAQRNEIRFADRARLPLRPFSGNLGVAPAEAGAHSVIPPRRWGGNLDIKHLGAGATLYLPIGVEGALFSLGDTHAAQGDGEVCGTAVEAAMDVVVRLSVRRDMPILAPQYALPKASAPPLSAFHVCTGVGPDLLEAARDAIRATVEHLGRSHGLEPQLAYALASVAVDLRIHEVVDEPNWVVGAFLPEGLL
ncbi:MAG TPA: acetamidase/formamidase family protein [Solirubrobacteraceae bacterium]|nr:acetamidase/formamidase family protein [Solirubrobacteraceae bacterium]